MKKSALSSSVAGNPLLKLVHPQPQLSLIQKGCVVSKRLHALFPRVWMDDGGCELDTSSFYSHCLIHMSERIRKTTWARMEGKKNETSSQCLQAESTAFSFPFIFLFFSPSCQCGSLSRSLALFLSLPAARSPAVLLS